MLNEFEAAYSDVPTHFLYSFRDKMEDGLDIFTLLIAFITSDIVKKSRKWNFTFYDDKEERHKNIIKYIFDEIIDRYYYQQKTIDRKNEVAMKRNYENKEELLILYFKLSMLIPIYFGYLKKHKDVYAEIGADLYYSMYNKTKENLVYMIFEIRSRNENYYNYDDYAQTDIITNILNKYWIFNIHEIYGNYINLQNFLISEPNETNDLSKKLNSINYDEMEKLNKIERIGLNADWPFSGHPLIMRHNQEVFNKLFMVIKKKMEIWIFYFMTGSFNINIYYNNYLSHSNEIFNKTNVPRLFYIFKDTSSFYNYKTINVSEVFKTYKHGPIFKVRYESENDEEIFKIRIKSKKDFFDWDRKITEKNDEYHSKLYFVYEKWIKLKAYNIRIVHELEMMLFPVKPPIILYGNSIPDPKQEMWFSNQDYKYDEIKAPILATKIWPNWLMELKNYIEMTLGEEFNSVLINKFIDKKDSITIGKDNDHWKKEFLVPILSFGRGDVTEITIENIPGNIQRTNINMESGGLFVMRNGDLTHKDKYNNNPSQYFVKESKTSSYIISKPSSFSPHYHNYNLIFKNVEEKLI